MAPHQIRVPPGRELAQRRWLNAAGVLVLLLVWEAAHRIVVMLPTVPDVFVPSIREVLLESLPSLGIYARFTTSIADLGAEASIGSGLLALAIHSGYTLGRFFAGMLTGLTLGIGLGLITAFSDTAKRALGPFVDYLRTVPLLALITVFLVWFGNREAGKLIFMGFAITVIIFANTVAAIRNIDPIFPQFARTLGASRAKVVRTVVLPAILPELTGGVRVLLATGWAIVLAAEFIAAQTGLGHILIQSQLYFAPGRMVVVLLVFMLYSALINAGAMRLARRLNRWKE